MTLVSDVWRLLLLLLLPDYIATLRKMYPWSHQHKLYQICLACTPDSTIAADHAFATPG